MERKLYENNVVSFKGTYLKNTPVGFRVLGTLDLTDSLIEELS
jgi:hypothetical protein